jgi:hypothetical protein
VHVLLKGYNFQSESSWKSETVNIKQHDLEVSGVCSGRVDREFRVVGAGGCVRWGGGSGVPQRSCRPVTRVVSGPFLGRDIPWEKGKMTSVCDQ